MNKAFPIFLFLPEINFKQVRTIMETLWRNSDWMSNWVDLTYADIRYGEYNNNYQA